MTLDTNLKPVDFDPFAHGELVYTAPATEPQREIWLATLLGDEANCAFNESTNVHLEGELDKAALETAVSYLIKRHDALRTTISADGELLCINKKTPNPIIYTDISDLMQDEQATRVKHYEKEAVTTSFDLIHGPLFQLHILKLATTQYQIILTLHHIIADGWSQAVLLHDLGQFYKSVVANTLPQLPPAMQYSDYAYMMQERQQNNELQFQEDYWLEQYANDIPLMDIPTDHPYPKMRTFNSGFLSHKLDDELVSALRKLGAKSGCTFFTTLLSAYALFLNRLQSQSDLVIGISAAGQSVIGEDYLVGHCVNMLPLRCSIDNTLSFKDLLNDMRPRVLDAYEHQEFTFGSLVGKLPLAHDLSRVPLVPLTFNIDQEQRALDFGSIQGTYTTNPRFNEIFELKINCVDSKNGFIVECDYNKALFEKETIERRLAEFEALIQNIVSNPTERMATLSWMPSDEQDLVTKQWNQTAVSYPDVLLHQLFMDQAKRTPDATAVLFEDQSLTYQEFDERTNQLAHYLQSQGVVPDSMVGVCMDRSFEMVIALYGILKAGGAYVPIDPTNPPDRIAFIVSDANAPLLLTQEKWLPLIEGMNTSAPVIALDAKAAMLAQQPITTPISNITPDNLAYVIYTSGSTGKPKGAMNNHRGIVNRLLWGQNEYKLTSDDVLLQKTPYSFDVSVWEFFWPLISGAQLAVAKPEGHKDSSYLVDAIQKYNITTIHFVPSMLQIFVTEPRISECQSIRRVICSGEALPANLQHRFFSKLDCDLHNLYGPTEAAIEVTYWQCDPTDTRSFVPIGKPVANTQMYIFDKQDQPVPIGVPGELLIGGIQVARGYHNREELTASKFVELEIPGVGKRRVYRTGDSCRWLGDGSIEFLGRLDFQVKLRGFRIELGEIESVLSNYAGIEDVVVVVQGNNEDDKRIVAYYKSDTKQDSQLLREHVNQSLPNYMIPSIFEPLAEFPLNPNGKIDRKALPKPQIELQLDRKEIVVPESETEKEIAKIWQSLLNINQISIFDDFFELGGHSLMAAKVINRIANQFGKRMSLQMFFNTSTVAAQAQYIDIHLNQSKTEAVVPAADIETIEL